MRTYWLWEKPRFWDRVCSWLEISKSLRLTSIPRKRSFGLEPNLISWVHCALMDTLRPQFPSPSFTSNLKLSNMVLFCLTCCTHTARILHTPINAFSWKYIGSPAPNSSSHIQHLEQVPRSTAWESRYTQICHNPFLTQCYCFCCLNLQNASFVFEIDGELPL